MRAERDILKRMACLVGKWFLQMALGLHQRIRSQGRALAKMDIRASRVLVNAMVFRTAFRTRIPVRRLDRYAICFNLSQTPSATRQASEAPLDGPVASQTKRWASLDRT